VEIQVFLDEPRQLYTSIALVEARGGVSTSLEGLTRSIQKQAAHLGGDAIILVGRAGKDGLLARVIVLAR
jgi:hypothetical protein